MGDHLESLVPDRDAFQGDLSLHYVSHQKPPRRYSYISSGVVSAGKDHEKGGIHLHRFTLVFNDLEIQHLIIFSVEQG